ncbi:MAG TPA: hypothetical protein VIJ18_17440, partial [Microbacteriaceae bacterium]
SVGAQVAHATVVGRVAGASAGLALLDELGGAAAGFQPYHAARAELLSRAGRAAEASQAYVSAIELTHDLAVREYLEAQRRFL